MLSNLLLGNKTKSNATLLRIEKKNLEAELAKIDDTTRTTRLQSVHSVQINNKNREKIITRISEINDILKSSKLTLNTNKITTATTASISNTQPSTSISSNPNIRPDIIDKTHIAPTGNTQINPPVSFTIDFQGDSNPINSDQTDQNIPSTNISDLENTVVQRTFPLPFVPNSFSTPTLTISNPSDMYVGLRTPTKSSEHAPNQMDMNKTFSTPLDEATNFNLGATSQTVSHDLNTDQTVQARKTSTGAKNTGTIPKSFGQQNKNVHFSQDNNDDLEGASSQNAQMEKLRLENMNLKMKLDMMQLKSNKNQQLQMENTKANLPHPNVFSTHNNMRMSHTPDSFQRSIENIHDPSFSMNYIPTTAMIQYPTPQYNNVQFSFPQHTVKTSLPHIYQNKNQHYSTMNTNASFNSKPTPTNAQKYTGEHVPEYLNTKSRMSTFPNYSINPSDMHDKTDQVQQNLHILNTQLHQNQNVNEQSYFTNRTLLPEQIEINPEPEFHNSYAPNNQINGEQRAKTNLKRLAKYIVDENESRNLNISNRLNDIENEERQFMHGTNNRVSRARDSYLKRLREIPIFNGETHQQLLDFLDISEGLYGSSTNPDELNELRETLSLRLRGEAKRAVGDIFSISFEEMKDILKKHFSYLNNRDLINSKLENLYQEPNESLNTYADRARKLLREKNLSYNFITEDQRAEHNRLARKVFSRGISNPRLKEKLSYFASGTLEDSIAFAIESETDISNTVSGSELFCKFCRNTGHRERDCHRKNNDNSNLNQFFDALRGLGSSNRNNFTNPNNDTFGPNRNRPDNRFGFRNDQFNRPSNNNFDRNHNQFNRYNDNHNQFNRNNDQNNQFNRNNNQQSQFNRNNDHHNQFNRNNDQYNRSNRFNSDYQQGNRTQYQNQNQNSSNNAQRQNFSFSQLETNNNNRSHINERSTTQNDNEVIQDRQSNQVLRSGN